MLEFVTVSRSRQIISSMIVMLLCGIPACLVNSVPTSKDQEARRLLFIAENRSLDRQTRADAVRDLGDLRLKWTTKRLINLLGQEYDVLMYQAIGALGKIGDPAALPALYFIRDDKRDIIVPGPFPSILEQTISQLERIKRIECPIKRPEAEKS